MTTAKKIAAKTMAKTTVKAPVRATAKPATKTMPKTTIKSTVVKPVVKPIAKPVALIPIEKPLRLKKIKLVRDSFTIPKPEYLILDNLKLRATDLKHPVKKGELIRAGIKALAAMSDQPFLAALKAVPMLKTGRPSK